MKNVRTGAKKVALKSFSPDFAALPAFAAMPVPRAGTTHVIVPSSFMLAVWYILYAALACHQKQRAFMSPPVRQAPVSVTTSPACPAAGLAASTPGFSAHAHVSALRLSVLVERSQRELLVAHLRGVNLETDEALATVLDVSDLVAVLLLLGRLRLHLLHAELGRRLRVL